MRTTTDNEHGIAIVERTLLIAAIAILVIAQPGCGSNDSASSDPIAESSAPAVAETAPDSLIAEDTGSANSLGNSNVEKDGSQDTPKDPGEQSNQPTGKDETGKQASADSSTTPEPNSEVAAAWFEAIVSDDIVARDAALAELASAEVDGKHLAARLIASADTVIVRRGAAFYLLERFDERDALQVAGVVDALGDDDATVSRMALQLILRSKRLTAEQLPAVIKLMANPAVDKATRVKAIRGLAKMPEAAQTILPELRRLASDSAEAVVRSAVVYTLSRIDNSQDGVACIIERLKTDSAAEVRQLAAARLGRLGEPSSMPALCEALKDADSQVRQSAADSLGRMGSDAVGPLTEQLKSSDVEIRKLAIYALGKNGTQATSSISALQRLAESDGDEEIRKLAEITIRIIKAAN